MATGWGIVGLGGIASRVATALAAAEEGKLAAVCSRDHEKAAAFGQRFGGARPFAAYDQMLADPAVEVVYVASPNALHAPQTLQALAAGKHVLVEKPMALTVADAEEMVAAARRAGRVLGVGFHMRGHPVHQEMRRLIQSGEVGAPIWASGVWGSYTPDYPRDRWQMDPALAGAGSIMGIGVHMIDLLRWLFGQEVAEVTAFADGPSERYPVEFLTTALLRFTGGTVAQFTSSRRLPNSAQTVVVYADKGRLEGQGTLGMETAGQLALARGVETITRKFPLRDLYLEEVEAFSRAVQGSGPAPATGEDGVRSVAVTVAVLEAARTGCTVRLH